MVRPQLAELCSGDDRRVPERVLDGRRCSEWNHHGLRAGSGVHGDPQIGQAHAPFQEQGHDVDEAGSCARDLQIIACAQGQDCSDVP